MLPKCVISLFLPIGEANQREAFSKAWPNRREHRWNIRPDCKTNSVGILAPSPALTESLRSSSLHPRHHRFDVTGSTGRADMRDETRRAYRARSCATPPQRRKARRVGTAGLKMEAAFGLAPGSG